jgi:hypothetical protein
VHGGGGGGERRALYNNHLTGAVPSELGRLTKLRGLCVRPASPLTWNVGSAMWVSRSTGGELGEERVRVEGGRGCAVRVDVRR